MSILNDLETTLDNGTNYATRNKIFDVLFDDMVKVINNNSVTGITYQGHHISIQGTSNANGGYSFFLGKDSYLRHLKVKAKESFSMVRLYELTDHFGLSNNELKLFLESDYIHIYQTNYRAYDMEFGTCIDFNSDIDLIYQYLENPEAVEKLYAKYAHIDYYENFACSFRKQILSLSVIVNDKFWTEFSEYISTVILNNTHEGIRVGHNGIRVV
jgi:hypothetical protein